MSDNSIIVKILADDSSAQDTLKTLGGKAMELAKEVGPAAIAIGAITEGIHALFEGEELIGINAQFEMLATNAGLAAVSLKEGLIASAAGLTTEAEILKAANQGIVQLGSSAKQLPELFELARKATLLFGGSVTENFSMMERAIASGNVRSLAHLGIVIDLKKAMKEFAESQGLSVDELTKAGRSQAVLNAALSQGETAFKGMNENIRPATVAWTELKVSVTELADVIEKKWAETIGPTVAKVISGFTMMAKLVKNSFTAIFDDGIDGLKVRQAQILNQIKEINKNIFLSGDPTHEWELKLKDVYKQYYAITNQIAKLHEESAKKASGSGAARDIADQDIVAKNELKRQEELVKSRGEFLALQQKNLAADRAMNFNNDEVAISELKNRNARLLNEDQNYLNQKTAIELAQKKAGTGHEAEYQTTLDNLELAHNEKRKMIESEANAFKTQMNKVAKDGIVNGLTSAFSGLGKAMAQGGDAFGAFEKAALSAIGGIAIQMGSMLVMAGLGWSVIPGFQASAAAVAEGLGLIVLGGALEGIGGSSGAGGSGGGGDFTGGSAGSSPIAGNTATQAGATGPHVNIQVMGNVFDNRQTGLAIVDAINEAYQNQGAIIAQVSQQ